VTGTPAATAPRSPVPRLLQLHLGSSSCDIRIDRRSMLQGLVVSTSFGGTQTSSSPSSAAAVALEDGGSIRPGATTTTGSLGTQSTTGTKPYAKLEALLPAARVKRLIESSIAATSKISSTRSGGPSNAPDLAELKTLLLTKQNLTRAALAPIPTKPAPTYLAAYALKFQQASLLQKPGALLVQNGELDTWKRLKRQERQRESQDDIRAALNVYTNSLSYDGSSYLWNAPPMEKSRLIREDRLPDVTAVIASDMGRRYLYRNEVLTAMQEARLELEYQLNQAQTVDLSELLILLTDAQQALELWFSLIDENDVKAAMEVVAKETV
jgi:hypothetical protein